MKLTSENRDMHDRIGHLIQQVFEQQQIIDK